MTADAVLIRDEMSEKIIKAAEELVLSDGIGTLTVRKILKKLGITNRVFYNRFRNIGEVLGIVYRNTVSKVRGCITDKLDSDKDFFEQVYELVEQIVIMSYDTRNRMSGFVFESDLKEEDNLEWWMSEIKRLIDYACENKYIKKVDPDIIGYSVWCFIRGYNADVIARGIPRNEAVRGIKYSFSFFMDGLKNESAISINNDQ